MSLNNLTHRKKAFFALTAAMVGLALLEGLLNSLAMGAELGKQIRQSWTPNSADRERMLRHDPQLGWTVTTGLNRPDYYGPGRSLHANSRGARGTREYLVPKPSEIFRIVCLGDSFTFGVMLDDSDSFPSYLAQRHPSLEAVNLGVSGYSTGQAWLRGKLEGEAFEPDLIIHTLIWNDIQRLRVGVLRFEEYMPHFRITDGEIEIYGTPVPHMPRDTMKNKLDPRKLAGILLDRSAIARTLALVGPDQESRTLAVSEKSFGELVEVTCAMYADANRRARISKSDFAVVLIPTLLDMTSEPHRELYRSVAKRLREEAETEKFPFLDLLDTFLNRTEEDWRALYLPYEMDINYHCSAYGYRLIADEIHMKLLSSVPRYAEHWSQRLGMESPP